jgi:hypothetical protein
MDLAYQVASKLGGAKKCGKGWKCLCPLHPDTNPSLDIAYGDKQSLIFHCKAGCDQKDLFNYIKDAGYLPELKKEEPRHKDNRPRQEVCSYFYTDVDGEVLFEKVRYEPKFFSLFHDVDGRRVPGKNGAESPLYMRHTLNDIKNKTVIITEGEKDCDFIIKNYGYICTSPPNGSGSWPAEFNSIFHGADVYICPDNDDPGRLFANKVRTGLSGIARSIETITIPSGKDVSDWAGSKEDFDRLVLNKPNSRLSFSSADDLAMIAKPADYLINHVLERDSHGMLAGASGAYKSFMILRMAHSICTGSDFFKKKCFETGLVVYVCGEGKTALSRRIKALSLVKGGFDGRLLVLDQKISIDNENDIKDLAIQLQELRPALVIFDTFSSMNSNTNENDNSDVASALSFLKSHLSNGYTSSIIVHHFGKDSEKGVRGASAFKDNSDFIMTLTRKNRESKETSLASIKSKDGDDFEEITAIARVVELGMLNQDGSESTSLVMDDIDYNPIGRPNEHDALIWDCINLAIDDDPITTKNGIGCRKSYVATIFKERSLLKNDAVRQALSRFYKKYEERHKLLIDNEFLFILK